MKQSKTLMGIRFKYDGSLDTELIIYKNLNIKISKKIINKIKSEIKQDDEDFNSFSTQTDQWL